MADLMSVIFEPVTLSIILAVIGGGAYYLLIYSKKDLKMEVIYLSEDEGIGEQLRVQTETPIMLYTEKQRRFIRNAKAYVFKIGRSQVTRWFAKRGTAFTHGFLKSETNEEGKIIKGERVEIGTLYNTLLGLWGDKVMKDLKPARIQELIEAQIFVTVDLEPGFLPDGYKGVNWSEKDIKKEVDRNMAELIGEGIIRHLSREDWIRNIGLMAAGIVLWELIKNLGLFAPE